jgi:hypothetical protein
MKAGKLRIRPGDAGKAKGCKGELYIWESLLEDSCGVTLLSARMARTQMLRFSWGSSIEHSTRMLFGR